jgi:uncharacterized protein (DUF2126 family)
MTISRSWDESIARALAAHDKLLASQGFAVWVGGEPTFADSRSSTPEWNIAADGEDKLARALIALSGLAERFPGAALLRTLGRQYPEEDRPRFSVGIYTRRDGKAVWDGPPDPCVEPPKSSFDDIERLRREIGRRLDACGYHVVHMDVDDPLPHRLVFAKAPIAPDKSRAGTSRPSIHNVRTSFDGPREELSEQGLFLLALGLQEGYEYRLPRVELPNFATVGPYLDVLGAISQAARTAELSSIVLAGFGPPVDATVAFTTITPDPGVLEFNMAPSSSCTSLLEGI